MKDRNVSKSIRTIKLGKLSTLLCVYIQLTKRTLVIRTKEQGGGTQKTRIVQGSLGIGETRSALINYFVPGISVQVLPWQLLSSIKILGPILVDRLVRHTRDQIVA
jgi:hypothetical protein